MECRAVVCRSQADGYSFTEHLARSLLFSAYSDEAMIGMFTAYTAYFDASGHPDEHKVMTVGGFVSTVKKWGRFDTEWTAILQSEGVTAFHMTDFASSNGEFTAWKGQTERRKNFVRRLEACIKRNVNKAFRSSLVIPHYDEVNAIYKLEEAMGRPYAACANECLMGMSLWIVSKNINPKHVLCFFEDGDKDKGSFQEIAKRTGWYHPWPKFLCKHEAIAFQAADFSAWKYRTAFQESLKANHTHEKAKRLFDSVSGIIGIPHGGSGIHRKEHLLQFCHMTNVERRARV
jgi:hypothetical protein